MARARPKQHIRKLKSGKKVVVNRGVKKRSSERAKLMKLLREEGKVPLSVTVPVGKNVNGSVPMVSYHNSSSVKKRKKTRRYFDPRTKKVTFLNDKSGVLLRDDIGSSPREVRLKEIRNEERRLKRLLDGYLDSYESNDGDTASRTAGVAPTGGSYFELEDDLDDLDKELKDLGVDDEDDLI